MQNQKPTNVSLDAARTQPSIHADPVQKVLPPTTIETPKTDGDLPKLDAGKYTLDPNDLNARRSKNVHDLAMYGKDVQRRASFNPRPKESPFSPELQAQMKLGHEKMMEEEARKKMERLESSHEGQTELVTTVNNNAETSEVEFSLKSKANEETSNEFFHGCNCRKSGNNGKFLTLTYATHQW